MLNKIIFRGRSTRRYSGCVSGKSFVRALCCHIYRCQLLPLSSANLHLHHLTIASHVAAYQMLTESHLILWWIGYHPPYLADEDTQGLTQGQEQFSKLNLGLLGTFRALDGQKAQLYSFHWLPWQRKPTHKKLPFPGHFFSSNLHILTVTNTHERLWTCYCLEESRKTASLQKEMHFSSWVS